MNNTTFEAVHAQVQAPFICVSLSAIDTLIGDPPYVYLVYSHIIRRAGYDGICWESVSHMAKFLRISLNSTKKALQLLGDHNLITRESRVGTTSIYRVNNPVTVGVDHNTVEIDHNNLVHNVDHNNLGRHMVRVDHNTVEIDHNNLGHHMVGGNHHMVRGNHHMVKDRPPYDHKLDPYKLDPNKLDPNKLENHDHESDHFFSDDQEQNPNPSSEALDQKPIVPDPVMPDPVMPNHLDQKPQPKIMPKPILKSKQCNSDHPIDHPPIQIDQTPFNPNAIKYDLHAKRDTPCPNPECGGLDTAFNVDRYGSCSDCWVKNR